MLPNAQALLGEEFDRDPFVLFKLRGLSREELIGLLSSGPAEGRAAPSRGKAKRAVPKPEAAAPAEPLPVDAQAFWNGGSLQQDWLGDVQISPVAAALPKRLGNFPFWRGAARFLEALEPVYRQASSRGLDVFLGEGRWRPNGAEESSREGIPQKRVVC